MKLFHNSSEPDYHCTATLVDWVY